MEVDPRRAQLDLAGSLGEKEAAEFVAELWSLMRCGSAAIAGARAEEERDGQAVAREGGVVVAVAIPSSSLFANTCWCTTRVGAPPPAMEVDPREGSGRVHGRVVEFDDMRLARGG